MICTWGDMDSAEQISEWPVDYWKLTYLRYRPLKQKNPAQECRVLVEDFWRSNGVKRRQCRCTIGVPIVGKGPNCRPSQHRSFILIDKVGNGI